MRSIFLFIVIALLIAPVAIAQELKLPAVSQKASVMQTVGLTDVTITYSRPGVKGRVIWGGLVPYDKVWRTGANEATGFIISQDVKIGGQNLPAGTYSLHTIPGKQEWTIIFNKDAEQWGSYSYDQTKDSLRIKVKPQEGPHQEWMMFSFRDVQMSSATVELAWEKLRVSFDIETDTVNQAMMNIHNALSGEVTDWTVPYGAANFITRAKTGSTEQALKWVDQSISLKETYWNMRFKASLLADQGKTADAIAVAEKAVMIGKENKDEPTEVAKTEKLIADWKASTESK